MKIKLYTILTDNDDEELEKLVNNFLRDGWELYGNPVMAMCVAPEEYPSLRLAQAMVLRDDEGTTITQPPSPPARSEPACG